MLTVSAGSSSFTPIDPGTYPAVCYGLVDIGDQYSDAYEKWTHKVIILWEIPGEDGQESHSISQKYTASLNERSSMRRDLSAWRGRDFTEEELHAFDLHTIVGAPCLLNVIHREYNGQKYANVSGVMKLPKGMIVTGTTYKPMVFDIDEDPIEELGNLPEWITKQIMASRQYKNMTAPVTDVSSLDLTEDDEVPF